MTEPTTIVLVHTVPPLIAVFDQLGKRLLPGARLLHVLDEPLLERVRLRKQLADEDAERLAGHVALAAEIGAQAVLVTCSTISPCVNQVRKNAAVPVFRIDEAMIAQAVQTGGKIGVIATNRTTLEPTRTLLNREAERRGKTIEVELVLVPGALPALLAGDGDKHDALLVPALLDLVQRVDIVVLAQASMARVLDVIDAASLPIQILSSPHMALQQVEAWLIDATINNREVRAYR